MLRLENKLLGSLGVTVAFLAIGLNFSKPATANIVRQADYEVKHRFVWSKKSGPPLPSVYKGQWNTGGIAQVADSTKCSQFNRYNAIINIAPGLNDNRNKTADCPFANSKAESFITLNNYGPNVPIEGTIGVKGFANINVPEREAARANAFSRGSVSFIAGREFVKGKIIWTPNFMTSVSGSRSGGHAVSSDPISFIVSDPNNGNILLQTTLLDIDSTIEGDGVVSWNSSGIVDINTLSDATFKIAINSPYTIQQGSIDIKTKDGIFTQADDSGIYDGIIPLGILGTSTPLSLNIGDVPLDYDLGFDSQDVNVELDLSGSGSASVAVPENSSSVSLLALGTLGAASTLKRKLKPSKSTEKETTKVG